MSSWMPEAFGVQSFSLLLCLELTYFLSCEGNKETAALLWFPVDRLVITIKSFEPQEKQVLMLWEFPDPFFLIIYQPVVGAKGACQGGS